MDIIRECMETVIQKLPTDLGLTEACYQRCLHHYLSKYGSVQQEVQLAYVFEDDGGKICTGAGRMDLVWRPHRKVEGCAKIWILELKVQPKVYKLSSFFPQVRRYCYFYKKQFGPCEGVTIVFSPFCSQAHHTVKSSEGV